MADTDCYGVWRLTYKNKKLIDRKLVATCANKLEAIEQRDLIHARNPTLIYIIELVGDKPAPPRKMMNTAYMNKKK